jgi:hypothetical protein
MVCCEKIYSFGTQNELHRHRHSGGMLEHSAMQEWFATIAICSRVASQVTSILHVVGSVASPGVHCGEQAGMAADAALLPWHRAMQAPSS